MGRIIPGLGLAAGWLLLLFFGSSMLFIAVMVVMALIGSKEYVRMVVKTHEDDGRKLFLIPLLIFPLLGSVCSMFGLNTITGVEGMQLGLMLSFVTITFYLLCNYTKTEDVFRLYSQAVFGAVYVGCLSAFLLLLYHLPSGNLWLVILSTVTAGSDTGAYVVGTQLGKHKLCPNVSPKKTVEGAFGGLVFALIFAAVFGQMLLPQVNILFILAAAALLTGVSISGDLTESIIKRGTGTKDSGTILAGHGGVLDRMDSMLFAGPFLYYLLIFSGVV